MEKKTKCLFLNLLYKKCKERYVNIKEVVKEIIEYRLISKLEIFLKSKIIEPRLEIRYKNIENLIISFKFILLVNPPNKVIPLRDIPGIKAKP